MAESELDVKTKPGRDDTKSVSEIIKIKYCEAFLPGEHTYMYKTCDKEEVPINGRTEVSKKTLETCAPPLYDYNQPGVRATIPIETCDKEEVPINGWTEVSQKTLETCAPPLYDYNQPGVRATIPIDELIHVTHNEEAKDIRPNPQRGRGMKYTFTPHIKYGKDYSGDNGSYVKVEDGSFKKIKADQCVLPGQLSWWSPNISLIEGRKYSDYRSSINTASRALYREGIFLAPYLSNPVNKSPECRYGHCGFVVGFKDLLESYKKSRRDMRDEDKVVYLRIGGTLRYRYEICYVVIVCTKFDEELEDKYPSLYDSEVFDHNDFVLKSGEINFGSVTTIDFKSEYVVKCVCDPPAAPRYFNYEIPAFAFYYPQQDTKEIDFTLTCEGVTEVEREHNCKQMKCKR